MSNVYLEKIAKEYYQQTYADDADKTRWIGTAVVGAGTAGIGAKYLNRAFQVPISHVATQGTPHISKEVLNRMKEDVLKNTGTTFNVRDIGGNPHMHDMIDMIGKQRGDFYLHKDSMPSMQSRIHTVAKVLNKARPFVGPLESMIPKYNNELADTSKAYTKNYIHSMLPNTDVQAHEMGHAVDYSKGNLAMKRHLGSVGKLLHGAPSAAIGGALLGSEKTRDYAWMAPLVASAPVIREEFMANKHGYDLIKKHGGKPGKFLGLAAANLLGYAAAPAIASGALAGINIARRKGEEFDPEDYFREQEIKQEKR